MIFILLIQFEVNYSPTFFPRHLSQDDQETYGWQFACVFSCDTQKLHSLFLATFCLLQNTCLLNKKYSFFKKNKVPSCVINVMLSTTTKLDIPFCVTQQKLFTWK